ncbi:hypothetical protein BHE74_00059281 [Ensete ventricosum]|nr:hypothetical protein BHE74_00059281 [Ensete ventricosum]
MAMAMPPAGAATHDQGPRKGGYTRPGSPAGTAARAAANRRRRCLQGGAHGGAPSGMAPARKRGTYSTRPPTGQQRQPASEAPIAPVRPLGNSACHKGGRQRHTASPTTRRRRPPDEGRRGEVEFPFEKRTILPL